MAKKLVKQYLKDKSIAVIDFSHDVVGNVLLYPDIAFNLASAIRKSTFERGLLFCSTEIGMAIVANKAPGVRAALCHDVYSAERARKSNNAQIMTLGTRVVGAKLAVMLVETWLGAEFEAGESKSKVKRIDYYEALLHPECATSTDK